ncbi:MAG: alpha-mannosidase [Acidimicrobiia bacterium]
MHDDQTLLEARFVKERARIVPAVHRRSLPLTVLANELPGEPVPFAEAVDGSFETITVGAPWGRRWGTTWFRLLADVPTDWAGPLEVTIDLGFHARSTGFQCEGLVYTADGQPLQGVHPNRTGIPLPDLRPGDPLELYVEAAANPGFDRLVPSSIGASTAGDGAPIYRLVRAELVERDDEVIALLHDLDVLAGVMRSLPPDEPRRRRLLQVLSDAHDALDLLDVASTTAAARAVVRPALQLPAHASAHRIVAVGHAHIDTAWLWPLRETARKCTRTFASALRLMDAMPDFRFVCSQAAQYAWIEERFPDLFERIKEKVRSGQWIPVGGMWVEPDMNLPSGESIVRQLVHGQRAFERWFGRRCEEVWVPDVFGYPGSLPQIFAQGGCERFVTQKLSWNKQNAMPHHTFWWEGIDGTRVLTHFPPVDTYNAEMVPKEIAFAGSNFREAGWSDWSLMPYGYGNGGGGATREMVERARRLADLDGSPRIELGTVEQFFDAVEAEIAAGAPVPVWAGELYFEMHRGTYTSQLGTKLGNRHCERLLREAELWWAHSAADAAVQSELDALWKDVLLHQFHDILPGSSIAWVHEEAELALGRSARRLDELVDEALSRIASPEGSVANVRTHAADEIVITDIAPPDGGQLLTNGTHAYRVAAPGLGLTALEALPVADRVVVDERRLSNGLVDVRLDELGQLVSVHDLVRDRELLPTDAAGAVLLFGPDHPVEYEAWDIESWARRLARPVTDTRSIEIVEPGPLVGSIRVSRSFGASTATITYRLRAASPRIDIELDIDWQDREKVLSIDFPLAVRADRAACGIQFGHVHRPTHRNTSWDAAKFEVCAHRWVDVAEPGFGVAVLDDGRFGHDVQGDGVRVTLLRSAIWPDLDADRGRHRTTVALLPHGPGLHDVLREAEALELPLRVVRGKADRPVQPLVRIEHPGVLVSAVKLADDGSGDLIVRLHEAHGDRTTVTVGSQAVAAWRAALTEEALEELRLDAGELAVPLRPFELATLRLRPARSSAVAVAAQSGGSSGRHPGGGHREP